MTGNATSARVLMVGPDRSLRGGIVTVVDGYFHAGLADCCAAFSYLGTGVGSNLLSKSLAFARVLPFYERTLRDFDIVHLHISAKGSFWRKSMMAAMAKRAGKKVILHEHSGEFARDFETGGDSYREKVRTVFNGVDRVVVLSEEWRDYFADNVMLDSEKLKVLHNGVPVPAKPCSPCSHKNVLFLGRLDSNKSPDVLLRASKDVLATFPGMRLVFGGNGNLEHYKTIAYELGIADRCDFLGWVSGEDKERLFERSGIYCLPSKNEAMPMSLMEAMAHGVPVIATRVGGVPQLVENGIDGLLMDVDDVAALSRLLVKLAGSTELRTELGLAGRKKIELSFSINTAIDRLVGIYQNLYEEEHA